ncbi:hypothetical protein C8R45DRAFT_1112624 [Mycena sanguinolenta]|nr:hypothetical protein C8R45DRAFT_1112624 [Mycena sanguinolenta]
MDVELLLRELIHHRAFAAQTPGCILLFVFIVPVRRITSRPFASGFVASFPPCRVVSRTHAVAFVVEEASCSYNTSFTGEAPRPRPRAEQRCDENGRSSERWLRRRYGVYAYHPSLPTVVLPLYTFPIIASYGAPGVRTVSLHSDTHMSSSRNCTTITSGTIVIVHAADSQNTKLLISSW